MRSPNGSEFKICGIDCAEVFGPMSGITERYLNFLRRNKKTTFKVLIVDPRSEVPYDKRLAESRLLVGGVAKYEANLPGRIYDKIVSSIQIMAELKAQFPQQFEVGYLEERPLGAFVLNGETGTFVLYSPCHKGWDSPVLLLKKRDLGLYTFIEEYFDYAWTNHSKLSENEETARKALIEKYSQIFATLEARARTASPSS